MNWQLASALYVWQIDVDGLGRDALGAVNQLAGLLPAGHAAADDALTHLAMAAEEWGPRGAVIDGPKLRSMLEQRGIVNSSPAVTSAGWLKTSFRSFGVGLG